MFGSEPDLRIHVQNLGFIHTKCGAQNCLSWRFYDDRNLSAKVFRTIRAIEKF